MSVVIRGIYGTEGVRVEYEYDDADNKVKALHYSNLTQRPLRVTGPGGFDRLLAANVAQTVNLVGLQLKYRETPKDADFERTFDPLRPHLRDPLDHIPFAFTYPGDA